MDSCVAQKMTVIPIISLLSLKYLHIVTLNVLTFLMLYGMIYKKRSSKIYTRHQTLNSDTVHSVPAKIDAIGLILIDSNIGYHTDIPIGQNS